MQNDPKGSPYNVMGLGVHEYRTPIASDCVAGLCSLNDCRYPDCSVSGLKSIGMIVDDPIPDQFALKTGDQILADINTAFEKEFGPLVKPVARTAEERADIERYYDFIGQQMKGTPNV